MILSAQSIRRLIQINPFHERTVHNGMTFGLSPAGYDIRIREDVRILPGKFRLASALEHIRLDNKTLARITDKSSWARKGIAVQNTVIEPGWYGFLTLEITNHGDRTMNIKAYDPIAQIIFEQLDEETEQPYTGKYQGQGPIPISAKDE